jgi:type I restriction enzyme, S subunit
MRVNDLPVALLGDLVNIVTGKLDSNQAVPGGRYPFFTCSPRTLEIDSYAFDCEAVLLAGNNANGIFSVKYYKGKFDAYQRTYVITPKVSDVFSGRFLYYLVKENVKTFGGFSIGTATRFSHPPTNQERLRLRSSATAAGAYSSNTRLDR